MDFDLTPEQELLRKTARDFADREIAPVARDYDRNEQFPWDIVEKMKPLGFLGAPIPEEYGGMGLDAVSYCLVLEELARADSSVRSIVSVNCSLVGTTIAKWGTEEQKQTWLPKISSGEALGCFGLTEPGSGSDAASLRSSARRDGDDWILNGTKMFITNGTVAGLAIIMAQTEPSLGSKGIAAFLVPTTTPGFAANEIHGKLGLRASSTAELVLEDVRVPNSTMLGGIGDGMKVALSALDNGRVGLGASCVGLAQACLDAALVYSKQREQFGKPIASFQLIQEMLSDMFVEVEAARLLVWRAAALKDKGVKNTLEASVAKFYASEAAVKCANLAIQVHGGYGYIDEYPVGKYLRDARVTTLYEGTSQVQKLIIGRHLTGINAFS
ncbi:MAG: acyl-CoA dehydrogenase family protein [Actinomycetota bacterium]|nr:acyl-CoA dehydrogenase family protein [Actinomycetota bacterium]